MDGGGLVEGFRQKAGCGVVGKLSDDGRPWLRTVKCFFLESVFFKNNLFSSLKIIVFKSVFLLQKCIF